jgi:lipopolysaccharide export system permease protein
MATLMAFSRFSADNEIIAMGSSGISPYRLLIPALIVSSVAAAITLLLTTSINHKGNVAFRTTVIKILQSNFNLDIKERRFHSSFPGLVIYVNNNEGNKLKGVFIADHRLSKRPKIIEAAEGVMLFSKNSEFITMRLTDGTSHSETKGGSYRTITFQQYDLTIDLTQKLSEPLEKEIPQLSITELRNRIKTRMNEGLSVSRESVALHKKFSIPFGCLVLGFMGVSVGLVTYKKSSASGFGWGVLLIVLNYILLMVGQGLGEGEKIPAALSMWGPNVIMGAIGVWLMIRVTKDTMPIIHDTSNKLSTKDNKSK